MIYYAAIVSIIIGILFFLTSIYSFSKRRNRIGKYKDFLLLNLSGLFFIFLGTCIFYTEFIGKFFIFFLINTVIYAGMIFLTGYFEFLENKKNFKAKDIIEVEIEHNEKNV